MISQSVQHSLPALAPRPPQAPAASQSITNSYHRKQRFTSQILKHGVFKDTTITAASKAQERYKLYLSKQCGNKMVSIMDDFSAENMAVNMMKKEILSCQKIIASQLLQWYSSVCIQCFWRFHAAKQCKNRLQAGKKLTRWYLFWIWRKAYNAAALKIKRKILSFHRQKNFHLFMRLHRAAKFIQTNFRRRKAKIMLTRAILLYSTVAKTKRHIMLFGCRRACKKIMNDAAPKMFKNQDKLLSLLLKFMRKRRLEMLHDFNNSKLMFYILSHCCGSEGPGSSNETIEFIRRYAIPVIKKESRRQPSPRLAQKSKSPTRDGNTPIRNQSLYSEDDLPDTITGFNRPRGIYDTMLLLMDMIKVVRRMPQILDDSVPPLKAVISGGHNTNSSSSIGSTGSASSRKRRPSIMKQPGGKVFLQKEENRIRGSFTDSVSGTLKNQNSRNSSFERSGYQEKEDTNRRQRFDKRQQSLSADKDKAKDMSSSSHNSIAEAVAAALDAVSISSESKEKLEKPTRGNSLRSDSFKRANPLDSASQPLSVIKSRMIKNSTKDTSKDVAKERALLSVPASAPSADRASAIGAMTTALISDSLSVGLRRASALSPRRIIMAEEEEKKGSNEQNIGSSIESPFAEFEEKNSERVVSDCIISIASNLISDSVLTGVQKAASTAIAAERRNGETETTAEGEGSVAASADDRGSSPVSCSSPVVGLFTSTLAEDIVYDSVSKGLESISKQAAWPQPTSSCEKGEVYSEAAKSSVLSTFIGSSLSTGILRASIRVTHAKDSLVPSSPYSVFDPSSSSKFVESFASTIAPDDDITLNYSELSELNEDFSPFRLMKANDESCDISVPDLFISRQASDSSLSSLELELPDEYLKELFSSCKPSAK